MNGHEVAVVSVIVEILHFQWEREAPGSVFTTDSESAEIPAIFFPVGTVKIMTSGFVILGIYEDNWSILPPTTLRSTVWSHVEKKYAIIFVKGEKKWECGYLELEEGKEAVRDGEVWAGKS